MTDSEFTSIVQEAATLESEEDAERAAEATLSELGRNVSPGEATTSRAGSQTGSGGR